LSHFFCFCVCGFAFSPCLCAGQGAVTVSTMEEALMLAQVLASVKRPTVHVVFSRSNKHSVCADFIDAFLAGSSNNQMLQGLSFRGAAIGSAEVIPLAKALNWIHPLSFVSSSLCVVFVLLKADLVIRKLDLQSNSIGVQGARDLASALKSNRTLTTLDVTNNSLGPEACKFILDAVKTHPLLDRLSLVRFISFLCC